MTLPREPQDYQTTGMLIWDVYELGPNCWAVRIVDRSRKHVYMVGCQTSDKPRAMLLADALKAGIKSAPIEVVPYAAQVIQMPKVRCETQIAVRKPRRR